MRKVEVLGTARNSIRRTIAVYFKMHHATKARIEKDIWNSMFYGAFKYCELEKTVPGIYKLSGPIECVNTILPFFDK